MQFSDLQIDYSDHNEYADIPVNDKIASESLKTFEKNFRVICDANQKLLKSSTLKKRKLKPEVQAIGSELSQNGIANFCFSPSFTTELSSALSSKVDQLNTQRAAHSLNELAVGGASLILGKQRKDENNLYQMVQSEISRIGLIDIAENYLNREINNRKLQLLVLQKNTHLDAGLKHLCQFNSGALSDCYYMHIDSSVRTLKIIVYLSETRPETGAFRYIQQSQKWMTPLEKCIRRANDKSDFEAIDFDSMQGFKNLPKALRMKANFGNDLTEQYSDLEKRLVDKECVFPGSPGDGVIFDNSGIHRGAIFKTEGERQILQILLQ